MLDMHIKMVQTTASFCQRIIFRKPKTKPSYEYMLNSGDIWGPPGNRHQDVQDIYWE